MIEVREYLKHIGCSKEAIDVSCSAITNINGDHLELYRSINGMCTAKDDLAELKEKLSDVLGSAIEPVKRPYVRKPKAEASLIDTSGVAQAYAALIEQKETLIEKEKNRPHINSRVEVDYEEQAPAARRPKRKKESEAEIKESIHEFDL